MNENNKVTHLILMISLRTVVNFLMILFLVEGFVQAYHFSYELFYDFAYQAGSTDVMTVTITDGQSVLEVADTLETFGIIDDKYIFVARAYIGKYNKKIQAGNYSLGPAMTPEEICKKICGIQSEDAT